MPDDKLTVDHIDNIAVTRDTHHNNLNVLHSLHIGMFHLAQFARHREMEALEKYGRDKIRFESDFGSYLELLLGCVFDWFAISLVSYMRTIQLMRVMEANNWGLEDLRSKSAKEKLRNARNVYINKIAPDVLQWRNKIAAHRAATDPRSDSLALLTYSTFPTVSYHSPYYVVGGLTFSTDGSTSTFKEWSLTKKYEQLAPRYWPDQQLPELDW